MIGQYQFGSGQIANIRNPINRLQPVVICKLQIYQKGRFWKNIKKRKKMIQHYIVCFVFLWKSIIGPTSTWNVLSLVNQELQFKQDRRRWLLSIFQQTFSHSEAVKDELHKSNPNVFFRNGQTVFFFFFFFLSDEIFLSMDCYFSFTKCFDRLCRTRFDNWVAL